jgi:polyisoprenoid-binding protein YceI
MTAVRTLIPALAFLVAVAAGAEPRAFRVDPAASVVRFRLAATLHTIEGTVRIVSGEIHFDEENGAARGRVVLDARSVKTGIAARDAKLHKEVLESARHPEIVFGARRIEMIARTAEEARFVLHGELSIHGVAHAVALPTRAELAPRRARASSRVVLPYVSWGMRDVSTFFLRVANEVTVEIDVVGALTP